MSDADQSEQPLLPAPSDAEWERIAGDEVGLGAERLTGREIIRHQATVLVERLEFGRRRPRCSIIAKVVLISARYGAWAPNRVPYIDSGLYRALAAAGAPIPHLHWAGEMADGQCYGRVFDDLAPKGCFHGYEYEWSQEELEAVAEAVAAFHAAGLRLGGCELASERPWLTATPLHQVNGRWIARLVEQADDPAIQCHDQRTRAVLARVARRYDGWTARLAPWQTTLHGDVFSGNVALREKGRGRYEATLLDPDSAFLGLPQYDVEYLTQRGWKTSTSWESVRSHYRRSLSRLTGDRLGGDAVWCWAYRVALLQLMLWGTWAAIDIRTRGCRASDRELAWSDRVQLFAPDFVKACEDALSEDPVG